MPTHFSQIIKINRKESLKIKKTPYRSYTIEIDYSLSNRETKKGGEE